MFGSNMLKKQVSRIFPTEWMILGSISVALTIPMIFIMKNMSDSLTIIAEKLETKL